MKNYNLDNSFVTSNYLGQLFDKYGREKERRLLKNVVTTAGKTGIANQMKDTPTLPRMGWSELGTSATVQFTVTSANATVGATYTNNGVTFTVLATIAGGTTLYCSTSGSSNAAASGTLTKSGGTGDSSITFASWVYGGWVLQLLLNAYIAGSRTAFDSKTATTNVVTTITTFPAGTGTGAITEAAIFDVVTQNTANMWMYAGFAVINKGVSDSYVQTWTLTFS